VSDEKDDDSALFREAMGDIRPLKVDPRAPSVTRKPAPIPRQRLRDERAVLDELLEARVPDDDLLVESGEELRFMRDGFNPRYLRRLRRGDFAVRAHLDLHHMTQKQAREALLEFLAEALAAGWGCVRVVHGKGLRSRNGPVLKQLSNQLLRRHKAVIAFSSCRPTDGGTGAVTVLLRNYRPPAT